MEVERAFGFGSNSEKVNQGLKQSSCRENEGGGNISKVQLLTLGGQWVTGVERRGRVWDGAAASGLGNGWMLVPLRDNHPLQMKESWL